MEKLKSLATGTLAVALPKSPLGAACSYLLSQWKALVLHVELGQTRLDNNLIENAIRPVAVGRKNWQFFGHKNAGWRSAILFSLVNSCRSRRIDPEKYLRDVLPRLDRMKNSELHTLLPGNWKPL